MSDINAAGGVNGAKACHDIQDSGDSTDMSVSTASAGTLVASKPSVVIGAASSSVSLNVVDTFADNKIIEVSPANTAVDLSGYSPWYFRTAPPDGVQGNALGTLITTDGYSKVGFLVFNDTYGTGLRNVVEETVKAAGGSCTYGCKGEGDEFPRRSDDVLGRGQRCARLQAGRDRHPRLRRDQVDRSRARSRRAGTCRKVYLSDGNTSDFSADFAKRHPRGRPGHHPRRRPGRRPSRTALSGWAEIGNGAAAEGLLVRAPSPTTPPSSPRSPRSRAARPTRRRSSDNYAAVSGATDGEECNTYADCVTLLEGGKEIRYAGPSGIGPIDEENDPSSAFVGIYTFNADNKNELTSTVEGSK